MEPINYLQLYRKVTKGLSPKTKDIFDRRFGVKISAKSKPIDGNSVKIETLESIGNTLGITRERVRQIEEAGFANIKKNHGDILTAVFASFKDYFNSHGGFKKEETILEDLGGRKYKPYVLFLLTLSNQFARVCGKKDYHYFWAIDANFQHQVKANLGLLVQGIKEHGTLLAKDQMASFAAEKYQLHERAIASYLEISKKIQENKERKLGLVEWPEIKPRGVKDKAFLVFKKEQKPLHFRQITSLIDSLEQNKSAKKTHPQTVHNELIKDPRFVLVGRGMYALKEWGYVSGTIKDIIAKVIREKPQLVSQEDIVKEVLGQRLVAKNTVLINLNNKKYFSKDENGKYFIRETQTA